MRYMQQGITLIELVISMVIIGIALAGVLSVMNLTVSRSADPMIQQQTLAIAESYMEEILAKYYAETTTDASGAVITLCPSDSHTSRELHCKVDDYHGISATVQDQNGSAIPALSSYSVNVEVGAETSWEGVNAKLIRVTASHPNGVSITLQSYRADY